MESFDLGESLYNQACLAFEEVTSISIHLVVEYPMIVNYFHPWFIGYNPPDISFLHTVYFGIHSRSPDLRLGQGLFKVIWYPHILPIHDVHDL